MNKVKYDLKKILFIPLSYYLLNSIYLFHKENGVFNYEFFSSLIILTIVMIVVSIMIRKVFKSENENPNGVYFSSSECRIVQGEQEHIFNWKDLRATSTIRLWNVFYLVKFSTIDSSFTYPFFLFFPVSESFLDLVKNYTPVSHSLYGIAMDYDGEGS